MALRVVEGATKQIDTKGHPTLTALFQNASQHKPVFDLLGFFFGGSRAMATWMDVDIAVCTIEKANSLVNAAIEDSKSDQLGIVVMDELHTFDDENRGYLTEFITTKSLCLKQGIRLIGMRATLSSPQLIASWLRAKFSVSRYRPSPHG